jgi:protein TonB
MAREPPISVAPRGAEGRERRAPAPDGGARPGRATPDPWRRDRSTLHARLTDGAAIWQPARRAVGSRASSPEAVRREPVVGRGDATRTERPAHLASAPQYAPAEPSSSSPADTADDAQGSRDERQVNAPSPFPRTAELPSARRGVGPLDAEGGPIAFDDQRLGPATDQRDQRAASPEARPAITDFSRAGVKGPVDQLSGLGPAEVAGAVDRRANGRAAAEYGAAAVQRLAPEVAQREQDRRYQRYIQEIARRVNDVREFPKRLALRLEQGETIVRFVLETDGRISNGVQVLKSSGFEEFDSAAARAVQRAAPFPPMPDARSARPLTVSVRVAFENPVVR